MSWKKYYQPEDIWAEAIDFISEVERLGTTTEADMRLWFDANQPMLHSTPLQRENTYLLYYNHMRALHLADFYRGTITWRGGNG